MKKWFILAALIGLVLSISFVIVGCNLLGRGCDSLWCDGRVC